MRYLGIDYGSKKIGLALSDEAGTMGFPYGIVWNATDAVDDIAKLIEREKVEAAVIGESKDLAGNDNTIAGESRQFAAALAKRTGLPVHWENEVFTSAEARRQYEPAEKTRAPKARADVDASAAALILTSYLSKQHG